MLSALTKTGAEMTLEALSAGATDYLLKPQRVNDFNATLKELDELLIPKLKAHVARAKSRIASPKTVKPPSAPRRSLTKANGPFKILCIGTSTGGPNALESIVNSLTETLKVPTVIVQHMPAVFTRSLAERLDKLSPNHVVEGEDGQLVKPGWAYIGTNPSVCRTRSSHALTFG